MSNEKETREILNKTIAESQSVIDKAKADLAELDKPKYRFGDYGTAKTVEGDKIFIINKQFKNSISNYHWLDEDNMWANRELTNIKILGNCFDDMKRNQVDLKEFEVFARGVDSINNEGFSAYIDGFASICLGNIGDTWAYHLDQAIKIHQKLGQVIATKQRSLKQ